MLRLKKNKDNERGSTLVEFAIGVTVFATAMFAVLEFGRVLWAHNALTDAARRGARYAVLHTANDVDQVKNVVVFGDAAGTGNPMLPNLSTENVERRLQRFWSERWDCHGQRHRLSIPVCDSDRRHDHHDAELFDDLDR